MFNVQSIQKDFPHLRRKIHGKRIVYLDSTATSLKPQTVMEAMDEYNTKYTANIFRGIYTTSEEATAKYEEVRQKTAAFIGTTDDKEIIFTRNATESVNLVAYSLGMDMFQKGDHIATTIMEHHSNFVPWQQLCLEKDMTFDVIGIDQHGRVDEKQLDTLITRKTKLLAITVLSNVLGTIVPIKSIVKKVKKINPSCLVLVDAAQAVPHMKVNVQDWGADFVVFSSHKMLGPTGVGVLWGKYEHLSHMRPFLFGGEMIQEVRVDKTFFKEPPHKFEAGTPDIAGVIGLGAAIEYLSSLGMEAVRKHEEEIVSYAMQRLTEIPGLTIYGPKEKKDKGGVIAFTMRSTHPHDIAQVLNEENIFIRSGNHCAMPLHTNMKVAATARASFYVYTTKEDIDALVGALKKVQALFE